MKMYCLLHNILDTTFHSFYWHFEKELMELFSTSRAEAMILVVKTAPVQECYVFIEVSLLFYAMQLPWVLIPS